MLLQRNGIANLQIVQAFKKLALGLLFCLPLWSNAQDLLFQFSELDFVYGQYLLEGDLVSGRAEAHYENGQLKAVAQLVDGKLHGTAKQFYPTGQLRVVQEFNHGQLSKNFRAYYPNGEVQLRGVVTEPNPRGAGHYIMEVLYGYYNPDTDEYQLTNTRWKILEILVGDYGYTEFSNFIPFHEQIGFRVRERKRKNRGMFIEDSRLMYFPDEKPVN